MNTMNKTKRPDNTINEHRRDSIQRILDLSKGDVRSFKTRVNKEVDETENLEIKYLDIFYNIALGQYTLLGVFTIYNTMFVISKGGTWITPRAEVINEFIAAIHNWVSRLTYGSGYYDRESHKTCCSDVDVAYDEPAQEQTPVEQPVATIRARPEALDAAHYFYIGQPVEINGHFRDQAAINRSTRLTR